MSSGMVIVESKDDGRKRPAGDTQDLERFSRGLWVKQDPLRDHRGMMVKISHACR